MKSIEMIRWRDGTYGVRKKSRFSPYEYADACMGWWSAMENVIKYCRLDEATARKVYYALTDKGTPINA